MKLVATNDESLRLRRGFGGGHLLESDEFVARRQSVVPIQHIDKTNRMSVLL